MAVFFNEEFYDHTQSPFHPESPERLKGIVQKLKHHGLWEDVVRSETGSAEHLELIHDKDYVDFIRTCGECNITMDTSVHRDTYAIAALSAQCAIDAVAHSEKEKEPSFALTRPPGHHAGPNYGMGFCYFNNIAIAAAHLLDRGNKRIAIVDSDVHHGNGTEDVFAERSDVLYVSIHQTGIFPGTGNADFLGKGDGEGFTINLPLASGCGDSTYDCSYSDIVLPVVQQFSPDAILVSLGVDSHYRDPLASMSLSSTGHIKGARDLLRLSEICAKRVTFFLEGGYDVPALSEVVTGVVGALRGVDVPLEFTDVLDDSCLGRNAIEQCRKDVSEHWDL